MRDRVSSERLSTNPYIFFAGNELPRGCLSGILQQGNGGLVATGDRDLPLAEVRIYATGPDEFQLGSGYLPYPSPPSKLLYPLRPWFLALPGLALALYVLLPRRKRNETEAGYAVNRVFAGDFLGVLFVALFFALPPLIAGSFQAALRAGLPVTLALWPLSCFGLAILLLGAAHASLGIRLEPQGLRVFNMLGRRDIPFSAIKEVRVLEKRPPAWLRWGLKLVAAATANPTAAGMAMLQSASAPLQLRIDVDKGPSKKIWLTDQSGLPILRNLDKLFRHLHQAGVPGTEAVMEKWGKGA